MTQLDRSSHPAVQSLIKQHLLGHVNAASMLKQPLPMPQDSGQFCNFEGFWIATGNKEPVVSTEYVLTASVKANLKDLGRVVAARYFSFLTDLSYFRCIGGGYPDCLLDVYFIIIYFRGNLIS